MLVIFALTKISQKCGRRFKPAQHPSLRPSQQQDCASAVCLGCGCVHCSETGFLCFSNIKALLHRFSTVSMTSSYVVFIDFNVFTVTEGFSDEVFIKKR